MTPFFQLVFTTLHRLNIPYIVGADSLVGLSEGELCKYSHSLRLYIFPTNKGKWVRLALLLLKHRIILKPKRNQGRRFYKLRFKPSLFRKDPTHVNLTLLNPAEGGYKAFVGGHDTFFSSAHLAHGSTKLIKIDRRYNRSKGCCQPQSHSHTQ